MKVLGVRCSNSDYTSCLLLGTEISPQVKQTKHVNFPNGYGEAETLRWLHQEFQQLCNGQALDAVCIKRAEPNVKRSNSLEARIEAEAVVLLAAAESGCLKIVRKVGSTVAKDLGLKGKAKYLQTELDTSLITNFEKYNAKEQEAILVAWSCME